jgi:hypothetical protein
MEKSYALEHWNRLVLVKDAKPNICRHVSSCVLVVTSAIRDRYLSF